MSQIPHTAIPLLIGVTGHREIEAWQVDPVRVAVRRVFGQLRREYPHTPLVLLSPLAAGVDQLVAEVALEPSVDVPLVAVLPWARELDADVGTAAGERGRCDSLLPHAAQIVSVPLAGDVSVEQLRSVEAARQAQFDQAGRYIARHCQILIAVWDGVDAPESHTAKVVRWHREHAPAPFATRVGELDTPEWTVVVHLPVRRREPSPALGERGQQSGAARIEPQWLFPKAAEQPLEHKPPKNWKQRIGRIVRGTLLAVHRLMHVSGWWSHEGSSLGERSLKRRWSEIDRFNRDVAGLPQVAAEELTRNRGYLVSEDIAGTLPRCVQRLLDVYALADTAALRWQTQTWWTVLILFGAAVGAITCLETYAHMWNEWPILLGYLLCLGSGYAVFRWTRWQEHQGRWLDYRALAEALRVQVYWRWAGLNDCVADHYLRHFRGELDWIRHAARGAYLISGGHVVQTSMSPSPQALDDLKKIQRAWVLDQQRFFTAKSPANAELEISFETGARLAFVAAVSVTAYHLVQHAATQHMNHALVLATFGGLVLAALLEEYAEIHAYALLARRYRWMATLFGTAFQQLDAILAASHVMTDDLDRARRILFELGREALAENADWVVQHRDRQPTLPSG